MTRPSEDRGPPLIPGSATFEVNALIERVLQEAVVRAFDDVETQVERMAERRDERPRGLDSSREKYRSAGSPTSRSRS
jgi:hypothetical protein